MDHPKKACRLIMMEGHPKIELPSQIQLFHILPRLPAKSIIRFMSVSKQWHSFIKTPVFVKLHLHHVTEGDDNHNHHKLLLLSKNPRRFKFCTIDCEAPEDGLSVRRLLPFKDVGQHMKIIASFHGLVCIGMYESGRQSFFDYTFSDMVLWNPLTGDYKTISKGSSHEEYYDGSGGEFGLYCTSFDDDYRLLRVTRLYDAYIYSLKSDSWRKLEPTCMMGMERNLPWRTSIWHMPQSTVLNDKLYMLKDTSELVPSVVKFDIKTERFTKIKGPSYLERKYYCFKCLNFYMVSKECIHLFVVRDDHKTLLWRMDGDDEHWRKVKPSCYLPTIPVDVEYPEPLHCRVSNGNWLIRSSATSSVYELDPSTRVSKFLCSYAHSGSRCRMNFPSKIKFIGTLVSPNRYIN